MLSLKVRAYHLVPFVFGVQVALWCVSLLFRHGSHRVFCSPWFGSQANWANGGAEAGSAHWRPPDPAGSQHSDSDGRCSSLNPDIATPAWPQWKLGRFSAQSGGAGRLEATRGL